MRTHRSDNTRKSTKKVQKKYLSKKWIREQTPKKLWKQANWRQKTASVLAIILLLCLGTMYGIARWYIYQQSSKPLELGATFIPDYAEYLGINPQQTLQAMLSDLKVKNLRLTSYWTDIEPSPGVYDFSTLDWEFQMADQYHAKVMLAIGLRQPRWPECHMPTWAQNEPASVWEPQLDSFMQQVIERYKNNPALQSYQLENEYFLKFFGACTNFSRARLVNEFNFVTKLDQNHPVIIARSNNAIGTPIGQPTPDEFGVSVYKRVWDGEIPLLHRYLEYPFPAWFYAFLAGTEEIITGKNTIIHELQAEPWLPNGESISLSNVKEQDKSMNAKILKSRFAYGEATGIRTIYMWGAEWWYWRMVVAHDPSDWNVAKQEFAAAAAQDNQLSYKQGQSKAAQKTDALVFRGTSLYQSAKIL